MFDIKANDIIRVCFRGQVRRFRRRRRENSPRCDGSASTRAPFVRRTGDANANATAPRRGEKKKMTDVTFSAEIGDNLAAHLQQK